MERLPQRGWNMSYTDSAVGSEEAMALRILKALSWTLVWDKPWDQAIASPLNKTFSTLRPSPAELALSIECVWMAGSPSRSTFGWDVGGYLSKLLQRRPLIGRWRAPDSLASSTCCPCAVWRWNGRVLWRNATILQRPMYRKISSSGYLKRVRTCPLHRALCLVDQTALLAMLDSSGSMYATSPPHPFSNARTSIELLIQRQPDCRRKGNRWGRSTEADVMKSTA